MGYEVPFAVHIVGAAVADAAVFRTFAHEYLAATFIHGASVAVHIGTFYILAAPYGSLIVAAETFAAEVIAYQEIIPSVVFDYEWGLYGIGVCRFVAVGYLVGRTTPCYCHGVPYRGLHVVLELYKLYAVPEGSECKPWLTLFIYYYIGVYGIPVVHTGLGAHHRTEIYPFIVLGVGVEGLIGCDTDYRYIFVESGAAVE